MDLFFAVHFSMTIGGAGHLRKQWRGMRRHESMEGSLGAPRSKASRTSSALRVKQTAFFGIIDPTVCPPTFLRSAFGRKDEEKGQMLFAFAENRHGIGGGAQTSCGRKEAR